MPDLPNFGGPQTAALPNFGGGGGALPNFGPRQFPTPPNFAEDILRQRQQQAALGQPFAAMQGGQVIQQPPLNRPEQNQAEFFSGPQQLGQGVEEVAAALMNLPEQARRKSLEFARYLQPKLGLPQAPSTAVFGQEGPPPLPFQPGQPMLRQGPFVNEESDPINSVLNKFVTGMTTPGSALTLPLVETKPIQAFYLSQTLPGVVEEGQKVFDPSLPSKERVEGGISGAGDLIMSVLLAKAKSHPNQPMTWSEFDQTIKQVNRFAPETKSSATMDVRTTPGVTPREAYGPTPIIGGEYSHIPYQVVVPGITQPGRVVLPSQPGPKYEPNEYARPNARIILTPQAGSPADYQGGQVSYSSPITGGQIPSAGQAAPPTGVQSLADIAKAASEQARRMQGQFVPQAKEGEPNPIQVSKTKSVPQAQAPGDIQAVGEGARDKGGQVAPKASLMSVEAAGLRHDLASVASHSPQEAKDIANYYQSTGDLAGSFARLNKVRESYIDKIKGLEPPQLPSSMAEEDVWGQLGFRSDVKMNPQQIYNRLRNVMGERSGAWAAMNTPEFQRFMQSGGESTVKEVRKWVEEHGPRVEVRKFGAGQQSPQAQELATLTHQLDTKYPNWRTVASDTDIVRNRYGEQAIGEISKYNELTKKVIHDEAGKQSHWQSISPKSEKDMREYAELGLLTDGNKHLFQPHHLPPYFSRGHLEVLPDGTHVWEVHEVQQDVIRKVSDNEYRISPTIAESDKTDYSNITFNSFNEAAKFVTEKIDPLFPQWERLMVKANIEHANELFDRLGIPKEKRRIGFDDSETAMMTEGHDRAQEESRLQEFNTEQEARNFAKDKNKVKITPPSIDSGDLVPHKWVVEYGDPFIPQAEGMRLHYDRTLPKIAEELTGSKGVKVSFGEHKMAVENKHDMDQQEWEEAHPTIAYHGGENAPRKDLIFRNPDGTPKTDVTGLAFDLGKSRKDFTLTGKDKPKNIEPAQSPSKQEGAKYGFIGSVDSYGNVKAGSQERPMTHKEAGVTGKDRWRFDPKTQKILWTDQPSVDSMRAVENFLTKKGIEVKAHTNFHGRDVPIGGDFSQPEAQQSPSRAGQQLTSTLPKGDQNTLQHLELDKPGTTVQSAFERIANRPDIYGKHFAAAAKFFSEHYDHVLRLAGFDLGTQKWKGNLLRAHYDWTTHTARLDVNNPNAPLDYKVLHEGIHAATWWQFEYPQTEVQQKAVGLIKQIRQEAIKRLQKDVQDKVGKQIWGLPYFLSNDAEFIAGIFDPSSSLREHLNSFSVENKTGFAAIWDSIKQLLGVKNDTALDQALDALIEVGEERAGIDKAREMLSDSDRLKEIRNNIEVVPAQSPSRVEQETKQVEGRLKTFLARGQVKEAMAARRDSGGTAANRAGNVAKNDIEGPLRRAFGKQTKLADEALTFVRESDTHAPAWRDEQNKRLDAMKARLTSSTAADPKWKARALAAIDFAKTHLDVLNKVALQYKDITDTQIHQENANGIATLRRPGYVMHAQEVPGEDLFSSGLGTEEFSGFKHAREYDTLADSIAAGIDPKSLSASELLQSRVSRGEQLIQNHMFVEFLKTLKDPESGKSVATDVVVVPRREGFPPDMRAPAGYNPHTWGGQTLAVKEGYEGVFQTLTDPSFFRRSAPSRFLLRGLGTDKFIRLFGDAYHLVRLAIWESVIKMGGFSDIKAPLPSYRKGLLSLDHSPEELRKMAASGEIPQKHLDTLLKINSDARLAVQSGFNIGRVVDQINQEWMTKHWLLGAPQRFIFQQFQRGAMLECWGIEFERYKKMYPGKTDVENARAVSSDLNTRFGNLGRQGLLKSRTAQDLARFVALAPQWNEGLVMSELKAALGERGVIRSAIATAKTGRLQLGLLPRAIGTLAVSQFIANQIINFYFRGKPTWENPEKEFGAKISAWIPDKNMPGGGFFLHPFGMATEISHLLMRTQERTDNASETALEFLGGRLSGPARAVATFATRKEFGLSGRTYPAEERISRTIGQAIPRPIFTQALYQSAVPESVRRNVSPTIRQVITGQKKELPPEQLERRWMLNVGIRAEAATSDLSKVYQLASQFKKEHGIKEPTDLAESDYATLTSALRRNNMESARKALDELRTSGKTNKDIREYYDRLLHRWNIHSKRDDLKFEDSLTGDDRDLLERVKESDRQLRERFYQIY